jgi:NAD(P)-dependent dehydrogenase (short-subunit alcohol dehydrogenase family)
MRLKDSVAIVTGGGRGIGRSICLAFAAEGAQLVAAARTLAEIELVVSEIKRGGGTAIAVPVDVADEQSVDALVDRSLTEYGRIDILVNNAAISHLPQAVAKMDTATWDTVMAVNLRGAFLCSRAVAREMIRRQSGKIINMASIGARRGEGGRSAYRVSKAALISLTECLSDEVKAFGVNVNAICPGAVDTPMLREVYGRREGIVAMPPEDIAAVAVFLASSESRALHGAVIDAFGVSRTIRVGS